MASPSQPKRADPAKMSYEAAIEELESIVDRIEQGEIGLEESLAERRRGEALIQRCRAILDAAEQELKQISPPDAARGADAAAADAPD